MKIDKLKSLWILFLAITIVWVISIFLLHLYFDELQQKAMFGDSFGVINSLFSGLAFAGIIYAIFLQREEISMQKDELELTRKELKRTADAQIKINENNEQSQRISNLPIIQCLRKKDLELSFVNLSQNVAFDISVKIYVYDQNPEEKIKILLENYCEKKTEEGFKKRFEGLKDIDRILKCGGVKYIIPNCSSLLSNSEFKVSFPSSFEFYGLGILLQYRDVLGNNYAQFIRDVWRNNYLYYDPAIPKLFKRLTPEPFDYLPVNSRLADSWLENIYELEYFSLNWTSLRKLKLEKPKTEVIPANWTVPNNL
jgi:hypothetical protein